MARALTIPNRHAVRRELTIPNYHESIGAALGMIEEILNRHDMTVETGTFGFNGDKGSTTFLIKALEGSNVVCKSCAEKGTDTFDNMLAFQWYKMASGRFEINTYIS